MITKTIEYFAILKDGDGFTPSRVDEIFDSFEEARNHINDLIDDGEYKDKYKYCQCWTNKQGCSIERYLATPEMKFIRRTDSWDYKNRKLVEYYNWDQDHPYKGKYW